MELGLIIESRPIINDLLSPIIVTVASVAIYISQKKSIKNLQKASANIFKEGVMEVKKSFEEGMQANLEVNFNNRFAEIVRKINRGDEIEHFYSVFWGLQFDQFLQFKRGFISLDMFTSWMYSRLNEFKEIANLNFHKIAVEGWVQEKAIYKFIDFDFYNFIEYIRQNPQITKEELQDYIFKLRKK